MTDNIEKIVQEAECVAAADEYFKARTWIMDTNDNRRIFEAGFDRAYALPSKLRAPVADERHAVDPCGYVAVKRSAVDWLKDKFPALTIKAGLCERIGGRLYTITRLMRDHDAALASAPVAGESPMAKMADALREKARQEQQAYQDRRNQATEWGPMPDGTEADRPIPSAPVAHIAGDETSRYLEWAKDRSAWEMPVGTPVYYSALASAPVADHGFKIWKNSDNAWWNCRARLGVGGQGLTPEEAVRDWAARNGAKASAPVAGEARMPPGYRVKVVEGHGYRITSPSGSAWVAHSDTPAGDLIAALLAAPQASEAVRDVAFSAGVKAAADLVKKMVDDYDADLGSTDPETGTREYPGEGATWVCEMQELEESIRALSAQPGAQSSGNSGELIAHPKQHNDGGADA